VYSVRNIARPITAVVGGMDCVPSACRTKLRTMTIRVNDVVMQAAGNDRQTVKIDHTSLTGVLHSAVLPCVSCGRGDLVDHLDDVRHRRHRRCGGCPDAAGQALGLAGVDAEWAEGTIPAQ
jgi:hypothetical protein